MDIGHVVAMLHGMKADFIGRTVHDSPLESTTSQSHRKTKDMMVSSLGTLRTGRTAKLGGKQH